MSRNFLGKLFRGGLFSLLFDEFTIFPVSAYCGAVWMSLFTIAMLLAADKGARVNFTVSIGQFAVAVSLVFFPLTLE